MTSYDIILILIAIGWIGEASSLWWLAVLCAGVAAKLFGTTI